MVVTLLYHDIHFKKITENITPDEHDYSNNTEQSIAILKHLVQPENSENHSPCDIEEMHNFSEKLERFYIEIEAVHKSRNVHKRAIFITVNQNNNFEKLKTS